MPSRLPPVRSWLYAPGNNPKLIEKVFTSGADAVILDLEDAVPAAEKARARALVAAAIERHWAASRPPPPDEGSAQVHPGEDAPPPLPSPGGGGSERPLPGGEVGRHAGEGGGRVAGCHSEQPTPTPTRPLAGGGGYGRPLLFVRINHPATGLAEDDVAAVVRPGLDGLRLPKVEDPAELQVISDWVARTEQQHRLPAGRLPFVCNIESARGIYRAVEIASAHPRVIALGFGGADFTRDINAIATPEGLETLYARSQLVIASRLAGIRPPVDTVYRQIQDDAGLAAAARQARSLGFFGKSVIHPRQVPIVNQAFTPAADEIAWARTVVAAAANAAAIGSGSLKLDSGEFVDVAVLRRAEDLLRLMEAIQG